jgi:hypothetical protein
MAAAVVTAVAEVINACASAGKKQHFLIYRNSGL